MFHLFYLNLKVQGSHLTSLNLLQSQNILFLNTKYFILRRKRREWLPNLPSQRLMFKLSTNSRSNWNLEMLVFEEGGKPEYPEKNPRSKDEN